MPVDPKNVNIKDLTKIQVEDIVKGWIRFIKKLLKSHENKVRRFKAGFCFLFFFKMLLRQYPLVYGCPLLACLDSLDSVGSRPFYKFSLCFH